ncbi:hypothetical protein PQQ52_13970 [Paraburkholderia sediminicola]|uniref:hypothetical protein n=1 Tax=Paraburkholderia sediminicola TaxID=458836 RepID=UPI0038B7A2AC
MAVVAAAYDGNASGKDRDKKCWLRAAVVVARRHFCGRTVAFSFACLAEVPIYTLFRREDCARIDSFTINRRGSVMSMQALVLMRHNGPLELTELPRPASTHGALICVPRSLFMTHCPTVAREAKLWSR